MYYFNVQMKDIKNDMLEWLAFRRGPLSDFGMADSIAFLRTSLDDRKDRADVQVNFYNYNTDDKGNNYMMLPYGTGLSMFVTNLAVKSRGHLQLNPEDPVASQPRFYTNTLEDRRDVDVLVQGGLMASKILETKAIKVLIIYYSQLHISLATK